MKIKEYIIVHMIDHEDLQEAVNVKLQLGYQPVGNVVFNIETEDEYAGFSQAMVKYED